MIYLYLIMLTNNGREVMRTPHPTYSSCFAALDHAKRQAAPEDSRTVVMFCGDERLERNYDDRWYSSKASQ